MVDNKIEEGKVVKGGLNNPPTKPRPSGDPKGQGVDKTKITDWEMHNSNKLDKIIGLLTEIRDVNKTSANLLYYLLDDDHDPRVNCPKCKEPVVPNALGYCPECKTDLAAAGLVEVAGKTEKGEGKDD